MPLVLHRLGKIMGLAAMIVTLTLTFATPSTLAGGDGGGEPGPAPADLTLDSFTLTDDFSVVFHGTLTCLKPIEVSIAMAVQQGPPQHYVSMHESQEFLCDPARPIAIEWTFDPAHPALYHPGELIIGIEMEGYTVPDENGEFEYFQQFGIVYQQVRF